MDKMKFILLSVLMLLAVLLMPVGVRVSAETETDTAPTVMYKLINHDCIKLKWDEVTGADGYYIYRTDTGTGKTVKYKSIVIGTDVTIKNLSAETEYIFYVEPMTGKNGKMTVGQRSVGTRVTTPQRWYYRDEYDVDYDKEILISHYYREDYAKTEKEDINLGDIKSVEDIFYYNGWYYVIGEYDAVRADKDYPWVWHSGDNCRLCIARVKEDGTKKEILYSDLYSAEEFSCSYFIEDNDIYIIQSRSFTEYTEHGIQEQTYYIPEYCWLKKFSLDTCEMTTLLSPCIIRWFCYDNGYIYYGYDDIYTFTNDNRYGYEDGVYISPLFRKTSEYYEPMEPDKYETYLYRITSDGTEKRILYRGKYENIPADVYMYDDLMILYDVHGLYVTSLYEYDKKVKIYEHSGSIIIDIRFINGYIYITEIIDGIDIQNDKKIYCRIKPDGTDLTTQDTPFEWYY